MAFDKKMENQFKKDQIIKRTNEMMDKN